MQRHFLRTALAASMVVLSLSCGGDDVDRSGGTIEVLSPAVLADTIYKTIAIQVRVRDGAGSVVDDEMAEITSDLYLPETGGVSPVLSKWTTSGELTFTVATGTVAGDWGVRVRFNAMEIDTTFIVAVQPGVAATAVPVPLDTVLMVGGTAAYQVRARDQAGNLRSVPGKVRPIDVGLPFDTVTGTATGGALGRYRVEAEVEGRYDTVEVSVVPDYTLAGITTSTTMIWRRKLDRSGNTLLWDGTGAAGISSLGWGIAGTRDLVYERSVQAHRLPEGSGSESTIDVWSLIGNVGQMSPARDSGWIFTEIYYSTYPYLGVARFRPNGSGQAILTPTAVPTQKPSPTPDGTRFAYVSGDGAAFIKVMTIGVGDEVWSVSGQRPRWSPTGEQIAYLDEAGGHINLLDPADGSNSVLTPDSIPYGLARMSWTKDGLYLVAKRGSGQWDLIRASDGLVLPLWTLGDMTEVMFEP